METIISNITGDEAFDGAVYERASAILKAGGLVAFPTETVYGLGGNALDKAAAGKIYAAKGRPSDNPLIVHIAGIEALGVLAVDVPEQAYTLADAFWPGPLTMVLKKSEIVPYEITGGLETVAIRMPSHKTAARLIRESGLYIAAPSANTSGRPSPTKARYVVEDLDGRVDMIICDDTVDIGIESTIVDLSEGVPTILRPGYITMEMLQEVLGRVELDKAIEGANLITGNVVPKAPGMKYRHYAPKASLTLVEGEDEAVWQAICGLVEKAGVEGVAAAVMTTDENADRYRERFPGLAVKSLGSRDDQAAVARRLFAVLREFDDLNVDRIYSESFPSDNVGQAIMNRLLKAAGHSVLKV